MHEGEPLKLLHDGQVRDALQSSIPCVAIPMSTQDVELVGDDSGGGCRDDVRAMEVVSCLLVRPPEASLDSNDCGSGSKSREICLDDGRAEDDSSDGRSSPQRKGPRYGTC